ncbi:MAG: hypothetical protein B7Z52_06020 [Burkholderiales bacterium 12-64-5]|nr:MAG: hypothetical protein B7Z52_06020 [Burkholderiales bacterium 12-64-5]
MLNATQHCDTVPIAIITARARRRAQRNFALKGLMDQVAKSAGADVARTVGEDPAVEERRFQAGRLSPGR